MADTLALGASAVRRGGSSPLPRTNFKLNINFRIKHKLTIVKIMLQM